MGSSYNSGILFVAYQNYWNYPYLNSQNNNLNRKTIEKRPMCRILCVSLLFINK